jgi:hypothetical protein
MIAEAAYFRAERRGFNGGDSADMRRKIARLSSDARTHWQQDLDKLAALRDALQPKLAEQH